MDYDCPLCDEGPMIHRVGMEYEFYGCKNFPKCRGTRNRFGKDSTRSPREDEEPLTPSERREKANKRRWEQ
jgi:ssDNA-binding Zn-finger/Zn-ribbon topoisomerase 1